VGLQPAPTTIRLALEQRPDLIDVAVYQRRQRGTPDLVAHVAASEPAHVIDPAELHDWLVRATSTEPGAVKVVVHDRALPRDASGAPDPVLLGVLDRSLQDLTTSIQDAVAETLDLDQVDADGNIFNLGADSLAAVRLAALLEERLGIEMPATTLLEHPTPTAVAAWVVGRVEGPAAGLVPFQPRGTGTPWILVPPRPNPLTVAPLAAALGRDAPVGVVRPVALWEGRARHATLAAAAEAAVAEVVEAWPRGPYALLGDCTGAALAYEMARQLREGGRDVALLAVLDGPRPRARWWARFTGMGWLRYLQPPQVTFHPVAPSWRQRLHTLLGHVRHPRRIRNRAANAYHQARAYQLLATGGAVPSERRLPYARYLFELQVRTYEPVAVPELPLLLLASEEHARTAIPGWRELVPDLEHVVLPTPHTDLIAVREPIASQVAEIVHAALARRVPAADRDPGPDAVEEVTA
jgi:thioesterase domain-containing protein/acyl carrier protein